jgi:LysR family transcriptional activator of nhaA
MLPDWINYHHLRYFHAVAKEGSVRRAGEVLRTSSPAISTQIAQLERSLGAPLLEKRGRGVVPTEFGRMVADYAEQIFGLGAELLAAVRDGGGSRLAPLRVGFGEAVPKELAAQLLEPVLAPPSLDRVAVREDEPERLLADLALHKLDLVVLDEVPPAARRLRLTPHSLGEVGIDAYAPVAVARRLRRQFPKSLDGARCVVPDAGNALRADFERWLTQRGWRVDVVAECEDSALAKRLAVQAQAVVLAPSVLAKDLRPRYGLVPIGAVEGLRWQFVACTAARQVANPLAATVLAHARQVLAGSRTTA